MSHLSPWSPCPPRQQCKPHRPTPVQATMSPQDVDNITSVTYYMGQYFILFTMFFCGLNWAFYAQMRKQFDDLEPKDPNKKKKD